MHNCHNLCNCLNKDKFVVLSKHAEMKLLRLNHISKRQMYKKNPQKM